MGLWGGGGEGTWPGKKTHTYEICFHCDFSLEQGVLTNLHPFTFKGVSQEWPRADVVTPLGTADWTNTKCQRHSLGNAINIQLADLGGLLQHCLRMPPNTLLSLP